MEKRPTSSRKKTGRNALVSKAQTKKKKNKTPHKRPNSISLADLSLWINVVDECLFRPVGAFDRAAISEGYDSRGNLGQRIQVLEDRFGPLFVPNHLSTRYRSMVPTKHGAALADIFMLIELLFHWASTLEKSGTFSEVRKLREFILYLVPRKALRLRDRDDLDRSRILESMVWQTRLRKTGRPRQPESMSEWPDHGPDPKRSSTLRAVARPRS